MSKWLCPKTPSLLIGAALALVTGCGDDSVGTGATDDSSTTSTTGEATTAGPDTTTSGETTMESTGSGTEESTTGMTTTGMMTDATTISETTTDCPEGTEDCPCLPGELCDDGLICDGDVCMQPPDPACGDGVLDEGEECDDGEDNDDSAACKDDCTLNICGDGSLGPDEVCDDGNLEDTDECPSNCVPASCGDGFVQDGVEECDDGNLEDTDECLSTCAAASCGDGFVQDGAEECDNGDENADTAECTSMCEMAACGDGFVQDGVEDCDDGNDVDDDMCSNDCLLPSDGCPDGQINILQNHGFEAGVFAPFTSGAPETDVTNTMPHTGSWAAETNGNQYVEQTFDPVPVSTITEASYWEWHGEDVFTVAWWGYSDNTQDQKIFGSFQDWQQFDILADLDQGKSLTWIRAWGYSGGGNDPDISRFDDFLLCVEP